jgi:hypothetical protein
VLDAFRVIWCEVPCATGQVRFPPLSGYFKEVMVQLAYEAINIWCGWPYLLY